MPKYLCNACGWPADAESLPSFCAQCKKNQEFSEESSSSSSSSSLIDQPQSINTPPQGIGSLHGLGQVSTSTGSVTCGKPNISDLDIHGEFKKKFKDGWVEGLKSLPTDCGSYWKIAHSCGTPMRPIKEFCFRFQKPKDGDLQLGWCFSGEFSHTQSEVDDTINDYTNLKNSNVALWLGGDDALHYSGTAMSPHRNASSQAGLNEDNVSVTLLQLSPRLERIQTQVKPAPNESLFQIFGLIGKPDKSDFLFTKAKEIKCAHRDQRPFVAFGMDGLPVLIRHDGCKDWVSGSCAIEAGKGKGFPKLVKARDDELEKFPILDWSSDYLVLGKIIDIHLTYKRIIEHPCYAGLAVGFKDRDGGPGVDKDGNELRLSLGLSWYVGILSRLQERAKTSVNVKKNGQLVGPSALAASPINDAKENQQGSPAESSKRKHGKLGSDGDDSNKKMR
jgi:hypothetical protein